MRVFGPGFWDRVQVLGFRHRFHGSGIGLKDLLFLLFLLVCYRALWVLLQCRKRFFKGSLGSFRPGCDPGSWVCSSPP